jgi:hypothetical protein
VTKQILEAYFNIHERRAKAAGGKVPRQGPIETPGAGAATLENPE